MPLAKPPKILVRIVREGGQARPEFLSLVRYEIVAELGGKTSRPVPYDVVFRRHMDAAIVAPHYEREGERFVILRSCVRPPVALRGGAFDGNQWELPAGLIEADEDPRACAARELLEEIGAKVDVSELAPLGPVTLPAAGLIGERNHFFHVVVDPGALVTPSGDDSPLEEGGALLHVALREAIELLRRGAFPDAKTEIGLRRLAEIP
jgi:ADP-ribose pyrophosphatase